MWCRWKPIRVTSWKVIPGTNGDILALFGTLTIRKIWKVDGNLLGYVYKANILLVIIYLNTKMDENLTFINLQFINIYHKCVDWFWIPLYICLYVVFMFLKINKPHIIEHVSGFFLTDTHTHTHTQQKINSAALAHFSAIFAPKSDKKKEKNT